MSCFPKGQSDDGGSTGGTRSFQREMASYNPASAQTAATVKLGTKNKERLHSFESSEYELHFQRTVREMNIQTKREQQEQADWSRGGPVEWLALREERESFQLTDVAKPLWQPEKSVPAKISQASEKEENLRKRKERQKKRPARKGRSRV